MHPPEVPETESDTRQHRCMVFHDRLPLSASHLLFPRDGAIDRVPRRIVGGRPMPPFAFAVAIRIPHQFYRTRKWLAR